MIRKSQADSVHFALRIPRISQIRGQKINTIEAHNEVIVKAGRVALAKFGAPGTKERIQKLELQIEKGITTRLILIAKNGNDFFGYQSPVTVVYRGPPTASLTALAPPYYRNLDTEGSLWFVVESVFTRVDLNGFLLNSSGRRLSDVVKECRTSAMLVTDNT